MTESKRLSIWFLFPILVLVAASPSWAGGNIRVVVKTVLASQGSKYFDPRLSSLTEELQSLFRYSSYRLLSEDSLDLDMQETGTVSLPGKRVLKVTPKQVKENRVELCLAILKKDKEIFQTVIRLRNNGSIVVGGPKYKGGYLLFSIFTSF